MEYTNIIDQLKCYDTPTISDALDSLGINGALPGILPRNKNLDICGPAYTVAYKIPNEDEKKLAKASDFIDDVKEGDVIVLANNGREDCTVWGNILTQLALQKKVTGTIIDGACRDIEFIQNSNYPIYSKAVFMKSGKGRTKKREHQVPITIGKIEINPGDYIRADMNGVIVIPNDVVEIVINRSKLIEQTENKIREAISNGIPLKEAREKYKYHRPWEINNEEVIEG